MLIGYVSDENYVALADARLEFDNNWTSVAVCSRGSGAVHADIEPGRYHAVLSKPGFTAKRLEIDVREGKPYQFRLLSDRMYGFMWPKWTRAGETAEFCVHSTGEFRLELWRYGWEKEFVRSLGWCSEHGPRSMAQITPDGDYTQTGVQWNQTGYTLMYQKHAVVAPEKSGLYFMHATTRSGEFCSFPWIVMPALLHNQEGPQADVAVLTSSITSNAYNSFGGRSNYFNQDGLPPQPIVNSRQDLTRYTQPDSWPFEETAAPLSFNRPEPASQVPEGSQITDPIAGRVESAFAAGEWRLLGWLERECFDYDLYSDVTLHFGGLTLDDYRVLVLNNHPEYWSPEMYFRVKQWVQERGGKLMYLGGCGMYAEVEFPDEASMLCRREGETKLRGESEANLLGIAYTHSGFQSGAPYQVVDETHWAFAETGLSKGDLFGMQSLHERCPGGASAHELDKIGPDSPANIVQLAHGLNPGDTGADLTIYDTPSGGSVFAAGSFCWTLSLPIDDGVSAMTRNVLRRFLE